MEPTVAPHTGKLKRLAALCGGAIVLCLALCRPAGAALEALSTAASRRWPGPIADRNAHTSVDDGLVKFWLSAIPFLLLAAPGAVGAGAWARGAGLPGILMGVSSFVLILGVGAGVGALLASRRAGRLGSMA